jgi:hypothetical protein
MKTSEEKVPEVKEESKSEDQKQLDALGAEIADIIHEYQLESNIPISHKYWSLINARRALQSEVNRKEALSLERRKASAKS